MQSTISSQKRLKLIEKSIIINRIGIIGDFREEGTQLKRNVLSTIQDLFNNNGIRYIHTYMNFI